MSRRKPTPGYIALMQKLQENAIHEADEANTEKLHDTIKKKTDAEYQESINKIQDNKKNKDKVQKEYAQFRYQVKSDILENVLSAIVQKSLPETIHETNFVNSIVRDFVEQEGALNLLDNMSEKTALLSEMAISINEAYDEEIEDVDPKEPDTFMANTAPTTALISKIDGDEGMADITDTIKEKVSRATQEFIEKNVIDQQDIKDTLADTKERIAQVKTGDDELDEEIREEQTTLAKKKIKAISRRQGGVFEQLVKNMSSSILKNEAIKENYTMGNGQINMESIVARATCVYTMLEAVNTLKIKPMTADVIENYITFE